MVLIVYTLYSHIYNMDPILYIGDMSHSREPTTHLLCKSKYTFFGILVVYTILCTRKLYLLLLYTLCILLYKVYLIYTIVYVRLEEQSIYTAIHWDLSELTCYILNYQGSLLLYYIGARLTHHLSIYYV